MALWGDLVLDQVTPPNRRAKGQGYFRYYRPDGTFDAIVAVGGKLIKNGGDLAITGLPDGFQTTRMIEAVQYKDKLYIATGSDLIEYDGTTAKTVEPYKPTTLEVLYVGTNAISPNPDQYIQDSVGPIIQIDGVTADLRIGIVNKPTTFKVYVSKPEGVTLKYRFYYKLLKADTYLPTDAEWQDSNTFTFTPESLEEYEMKFEVRDSTAADTQIDGEYYIPSYKATQYDTNKYPTTTTMKTCNRIILHWDRLILYGDTTNLSTIYISHLQTPNYFPTNNTLIFETDKQEPLIKLVQFRDDVVAFLSGSIQALRGKSPADYQRIRVNTGVGCIAPESPAVFENYIAFLGKEGVYRLKSVHTTDHLFNVERLDLRIKNIIPNYTEAKDACGIYHKEQYLLCFPNQKMRLRYYPNIGIYQDAGSWVKDESPYFDICRFFEWLGELVIQSQSSGEVYQFDDTVFDDLGHVFESRIETKSFDFGSQYTPKKLKELQLLIGHEKKDVNLSLDVYADASEILTADSYEIVVSEDDEVSYTTSTAKNIQSQTGTIFGQWQLGKDGFGEFKTQLHKIRIRGGRKYRAVRVRVRHNEAVPWSLLGIAFKYRLKKP